MKTTVGKRLIPTIWPGVTTMSEAVEKAKAEIAAMPEEARKSFLEQWGEPEELHPDLALYVEERKDHLGSWIKHPLLFSPMHHAMMNGMVNKQYAQKRAALEEYEKEEAWYPIVMVMYERPYRLDAFLEVRDKLSDEDYWILLSAIWTDSENIWQNQDKWRVCFMSRRPGRLDHIMEEEESKVWDSLPEKRIIVYRGYAIDDCDKGMSWSLNKERAEFFAKRFMHRPEERARIVTGKVDKEYVLAYFSGRNEEEIVALPEFVTDREESEV